MMTRTPDEIKKGLECCNIGPSAHQPKCGECPYMYKKNCSDTFLQDTLALIQQLQDDNAEKDQRIRVLESRNNALYHTILGVMHFVDKWIDDAPAYDPDEDLNGTTAIGRASQAREIALQAIEQLQAERDAAVKDVRKWCCTCKHCAKDVREEPCNSCRRNGQGGAEERWEWRGVTKEGSDDGKE